MELVEAFYNTVQSTNTLYKMVLLIPDELADPTTPFMVQKEGDTTEIGLTKDTYLKIFTQCHTYWHKHIRGNDYELLIRNATHAELHRLYIMTIGYLTTTNENHTIIYLHELVLYALSKFEAKELKARQDQDARKEREVKDQEAKDQVAKDQDARNQDAKDQDAKDQAKHQDKDQVAKDQTKDQAKDQEAREQARKDQSQVKESSQSEVKKQNLREGKETTSNESVPKTSTKSGSQNQPHNSDGVLTPRDIQRTHKGPNGPNPYWSPIQNLSDPSQNPVQSPFQSPVQSPFQSPVQSPFQSPKNRGQSIDVLSDQSGHPIVDSPGPSGTGIIETDFLLISTYLHSRLNRINKSSSLWLLMKKVGIILMGDPIIKGEQRFRLFGMVVHRALKSCEVHPSNYYACNYLRWMVNTLKYMKYVCGSDVDMYLDFLTDHLVTVCKTQLTDVSLWNLLKEVLSARINSYAIEEYNFLIHSINKLSSNQFKLTTLYTSTLVTIPNNARSTSIVEWLLSVECLVHTPYTATVTAANVDLVNKRAKELAQELDGTAEDSMANKRAFLATLRWVQESMKRT